MLPRVLAAIVVTQISLASSALAQPPSQTPAGPVIEDPPGHRGFVLGAGLTMGWLLGNPGPDRMGQDSGLEAFLGWATGRVAYAAWAKAHEDESEYLHLDMGGAVRVWPWSQVRRLYVEARVGYEIVGRPWLPCSEDEGCEPYDRRGGIAGVTLGFELFTSDLLTVDARASLSSALLVDHRDYALVDFGLGFHFY